MKYDKFLFTTGDCAKWVEISSNQFNDGAGASTYGENYGVIAKKIS